MTITIIDTDRNVTAKLPQLKADGILSIGRYLDCINAGNEKVIKPAEARAIAQAGLRLFPIYEIGGRPSGAAIGERDGGWSQIYLPTIGLPPGAGIVVSYTVDYDAQPGDMPGIIAAFRAFRATVFPDYLIGCYGSGYVCEQLLAEKLIEFRWLTCSTGFAGSREALASGAYEMRQALPHEVAGLDTDPDTLNVANGEATIGYVPFSGPGPLPVEPAAPPASPSRIAGLLPATVAAIVTATVSSALIGHRWHNGPAPRGYSKGMAVAFGAAYARFKQGDDAALAIMAAADVGNSESDALAWYRAEFVAARMSNQAAGVDTLRHLFVLLIGLGMRESGGEYDTGRDTTAGAETSETAEGGLFQQSWNFRHATPVLQDMFNAERMLPDDPEQNLRTIFAEGVPLRSPPDVGAGDGALFQHLCKTRPLFAVMTAAVGLRTIGGDATRKGHWGPINRREAELVADADDLFRKVQAIVDAESATA